jgi:hypothetical protein
MDIEKIERVKNDAMAKRDEAGTTIVGILDLLTEKAIIEKSISELTDLKTNGGHVEIRIMTAGNGHTVKEIEVEIKPDDDNFITDLIALEVEHLVALDVPAAEFEKLAKPAVPAS